MVTLYRKNTALLCLVDAVPVVTPKATISDVQALLATHAKEYASIAYVYLVAPDRQLVGVVSIKEIFTHLPQTLVTVAAKAELVVATSAMDCEAIALLAWQHNLKAVPVIDDSSGRFLGVVTPDKIMDILHQGRTLDALRHSGTQLFPDAHESMVSGTPWIHIKKRLPWLLIGLAGGTVAASVVQLFEAELAQEVLIAAFIPLVVYLADAVGSQAEIIFVRAMALDPGLTKWNRFRFYLLREMIVIFALSTIMAVLVAAISIWWFQAPELVWLLVTSIMSTLILAVLVALWIPFIAVHLKLDPALTSGPVATVIRDVLTLVVYFVIVAVYLNLI